MTVLNPLIKDNQHLLSEADLAEWETAVWQYRAKHGEGASDENGGEEWF